METKIGNFNTKKYWKIISRSEFSKNNKPLFTVWLFKYKQNLKIVAITKYKTKLCIDGNKQVHGKNYWDTYYSIVIWTAICILLIHNLLND